MSRKGEFSQIFTIGFFVILVIICIAMLFMARDRFDTEKPTLQADLQDQYAEALLLGLLRTTTYENIPGIIGSPTIADLIIVNERAVQDNGQYDDALHMYLQKLAPGVTVTLTITYPTRPLTVSVGPVLTPGVAQLLIDLGRLDEAPDYFSDKKEVYVNTGRASAALPGKEKDIHVTLVYHCESTQFSCPGPKEGSR